MRCILVGNYGTGNLGDEALREFFLETFPGVEWTVLSARPSRQGEVPRLPCGLRSFFHPWWRTLRAYRRADAVVFGGGSLFTDVESVYACLLWWWHAFVARVFRKPVFLAFQGIGPFGSSLGKRLARWTVGHAAHVSVRDEASYQRVQSWNLNKEIVQTFDPVYAVFANIKFEVIECSRIVLVPRANSGEPFLIEASRVLDEHHGDPVRLVLLQPDHEEFVVQRITSLTRGLCEVVTVESVEQLIGALSDALVVVSERYHGTLAALALGLPTVVCPQDTGDKLDALRTLIEQGGAEERERLLALVGEGITALGKAMEG
ncbi:MAG: polysaccharide pyruvyl transferase family protein [Candidatus Peribacteraceae bacterium]